jgi:hypothetical protein
VNVLKTIQAMSLQKFSLLIEEVKKTEFESPIGEALIERHYFIHQTILRGKEDMEYMYSLTEKDKATLSEYDQEHLAPLFNRTELPLPPVEAPRSIEPSIEISSLSRAV